MSEKAWEMESGDSDLAEQQINKLANFIMQEIDGEPSQSQGAVDTAIRLLRDAYGR